MRKFIKRIKVYRLLKEWGVNHPWRASKDNKFIQF